MTFKGYTRFTGFVALALFSLTASFAQQTVDPSGACPVESLQRVIVAQTGDFVCKPSVPGSATGTWTKTEGMRVARALYNFTVDGGAVATITPVINTTIPANSIILGVIANPTVALTSGGSATIAIGTSAGSSTTALKGATAVASYTIDAVMAGTPVFTAATAVKLSAAGTITITVATATLTAGVMEILVYYTTASNA